MLNVAAAVGGGLLIRETLEQVPVPKLKESEGQTACKLSVRVLSASIPGLPAPGFFSRHRPYLEASIGSARKETEPADFESGSARAAGECPWSFDETLTFAIKVKDFAGPGLKLRLRNRHETQIGALQIANAADTIGEGCVDLQRSVLPSCVEEQRKSDRDTSMWSSPVIPVGFNHCRGGLLGAGVKNSWPKRTQH
mmetsp:Transcript_46021/g.82864  ORF Transcript_46021/g.82864 Transcript_46021/m.82864 type:complete len:196 (-) Transcript_46021:1525-2112(-)